MQTADYFRRQASECRRLADGLSPGRDRDGLLMLARHYDREAKRAADDGDQPPPQGPRPIIPA